MNSNLKMVAGPARVSVELIPEEEMKEMGLDSQEIPFCYGRVTSLGWDYIHISEGMIIIFDINKAIKLNPNFYILEGKDVIGKLIPEKHKREDRELKEVDPFEGFGRSNNEIFAK
jgi:hypothetical protein